MRVEKLKRLKIFVAEMKKRNYPNSKTMMKIYRDMDIAENIAMNISERTFLRDVETLRQKFEAPVEYQQSMKGYFLTDDSWTFVTTEIEENQLESLSIATKVAQDIVPQPLASDFNRAISDLLANNPTLFNQTSIDSFFSADTTVVEIDRKIFLDIYEGWKTNHAVTINYRQADGNESERLIEPHLITCANRIWYVKALCHKRNEQRIFAIHRINQTKLENFIFVPEITQERPIPRQNLFEYKKVSNVKLWCAPDLAAYVKEQATLREITYSENKDKSIEITLPELNEIDLTRWILGEGHRVKVIAPETLKKSVQHALRDTLSLYQGTNTKET